MLQVYESGSYLGEIDERFIPFQRRQLGYTNKALQLEIEKAQRYEQASPLEQQIIEVEERYLRQYQNAVNRLDRSDSGPGGKEIFRAEVDRLRKHFNRLRDAETASIKGG